MRYNLLVSFSLLTLSSAAAVQPSGSKSYEGYKVFRLRVGEDVAKVNSVIDGLGLATWKKIRPGGLADIVVPPSQVDAFEAQVTDLETVTMHQDLGASIAEESSFSVYAAGSANLTWFNSYHSYNDHLQFLKDLQAQYPTQAAVISAGNSLNGNPITGLHFWGSSGKGKPAIVFHGTVHAREWITTMVSANGVLDN